MSVATASHLGLLKTAVLLSGLVGLDGLIDVGLLGPLRASIEWRLVLIGESFLSKAHRISD